MRRGMDALVMELREYARSIIGSERLEDKLRRPESPLTDECPGDPELWTGPKRSPSLTILPAVQVKVPPAAGMRDRSQRRRILHAMANHELQAIELFAWALLAFPQAPAAFRRGLLAILKEEQRHCGLYIRRVNAHDAGFGDFGVTGYFWNRAQAIRNPLEFACTMGLTFENANLDFAQEYAAAARDAEDLETAAAIDEIHDDEIRHVAFGWRWLAQWKSPSLSMWDAFTQGVQAPLQPAHARGKTFDVEGRRSAGLDEDFIAQLAQTLPRGPGGKVRKHATAAPKKPQR